MLLRSKTKPPFFSIRGGLTKHRFFIRGVIVPPSKLIVTNICPPKVFCLLGGVNYEGGRSNQKSSFMRGVIVPPSKLIVKTTISPNISFLLGGFIIKGGRLYVCYHASHFLYVYVYVYVYVCVYECIYIYIYIYTYVYIYI